jgi:FtsZ-interacting cell division protein ZipA
MDGLRWFLLFIGLLIVVGVYFYSRRTETSDPESKSTDKLIKKSEPVIEPEDRSDSPADIEDLQDPESAGEQKIVTLRLVAKHQAAFSGDELALNFRGLGMRHGKYGIFHLYDGQNERQSVFCAASLV